MARNPKHLRKYYKYERVQFLYRKARQTLLCSTGIDIPYINNKLKKYGYLNSRYMRAWRTVRSILRKEGFV